MPPFMMMLSNGNFFRVDALCEGNPHKGQCRGALMFFLFEKTVEQTIVKPVILVVIALVMTSL